MALTDQELQDIISNLSPEERKQLLSQLGKQVDLDNITNPTNTDNTSVDGKSGYREVVIDVQNDKSVILVDRADYLPVRLTSKQFEVYQDACKEYEKQLQQEIDTNHQDD